jgi:Zn-dependent M16 (insulinase) family peptidase
MFAWLIQGLLDRLANRSFANGTNAWTDTDVTVYTISTVGQEGFLRFVPIYIDHILYASLTHSGYVTEVHHVNGEGKDAGVVYSEMQARENTSGDLMALANQRAMYPEGVGYRSETGGLMDALRQLDIDTIRRYHASYYLPQNLTLVIVGNINHRDLLQTLQMEVESSILTVGKPDLSSWKRPWVASKPAPPLQKNRHLEIIEFPANDDEDEEVGEFMVTFFGPSATDQETQCALEVLGDYLTDSPVSTLQHNFTEIEDPVAGDIHFSMNERLPCTLTIGFQSVPVDHLSIPKDASEPQALEADLFEVLQQIPEGGIDMDRIKTVINNLRSRCLYSVEQNPSNQFSMKLICEALYGDLTGNTLKKEIMPLRYYDNLLQWTSDQWIKLLKTWILDNPRVVVLGIPSSNRAKELKESEEKRVETRRERFGEEGLKKLDEEIEKAQKENNTPIPDELIEGFKIPRIENVKFIDTALAVYRSRFQHPVRERNEVERYLDQQPSNHPFNLVFSHTATSFVTISLYLTTKDLPAHLLPYLECYTDLFFALPILRQGDVIEYEKVVEELNEISVDHDARVGTRGLDEVVVIRITVDKAKYAKAVRLLGELFVHSIFDPER